MHLVGHSSSMELTPLSEPD